MSYRIPDDRRVTEWRINHRFKVVCWELDRQPSESSAWYWKLIKDDEAINGGLSLSPDCCRAEANWAYQRVVEGGYCVVEEFDTDLQRLVTRLLWPS